MLCSACLDPMRGVTHPPGHRALLLDDHHCCALCKHPPAPRTTAAQAAATAPAQATAWRAPAPPAPCSRMAPRNGAAALRWVSTLQPAPIPGCAPSSWWQCCLPRPPSPPPPPVPAALPGAAAGPSFPPCPCTAKPSGAAAAAAGGSADPPPPCPSIGTAELPGAAAAAAGGSTGSAAHRSGGPGGALPPGSPDARGRRPAHARRPPLLMTGSSPGVATGGQQRQSSRPRVGGVWHVRGHPFPGQHRYQATCLVPLLAHTFIATAGAALLARGASAQLYHTAHAHPPQSHAAALPALGVGDCAYSSSL